MKDKQEIERGACSKCECKEYHIPKEYNACDYCGCRPVDHEKISTNATHEVNQQMQQLTFQGESQPTSSCTSIRATVFLDVCVDEEELGRLVIELFEDLPKTSDNFLSLCTGDNLSELAYKDTCFYKIIGNILCEGGDITAGNGSGGMSIYGRTFEDEPNAHKYNFKKAGTVAMANNSKPNNNSSKFFINTAPTPWLDGKFVVFGRLKDEDSLFTLDKMTAFGSQNGYTSRDIRICDCGVLNK